MARLISLMVASIACPRLMTCAFLQLSPHSNDRHPTFTTSLNSGVDPGPEDMYIDPEDDELFKELRETKQSIYGTDIPMNEELRQSTLNAENAFLAAMLEQTSQFKRIKSEQGSDRAVEIFMERIKQEENPGDNVQHNEDDERYDTGSNFIEKIHEQQNPGIIDDDDVSSWQ